MSKTNCKNCGAALDICSPKCTFCGTKNINMTDIDLASGEAANFIFKLPNNFVDAEGKEIFLSMLAIPKLKNIDITNESTYITGGQEEKLLAITTNKSIEMGLTLRAITKHQNTSTCNLTLK